MKKVFTISITMFFSLAVFSQIWIRPEEATKHRGDTVNLIGFVTNVKYVTHTKNSSMLISLMTKDSKQSLGLLVYSFDLAKFKDVPYLNQYVQVIGLVEMYKGKPQIILHSEKQISIVREAAPEEE